MEGKPTKDSSAQRPGSPAPARAEGAGSGGLLGYTHVCREVPTTHTTQPSSSTKWLCQVKHETGDKNEWGLQRSEKLSQEEDSPLTSLSLELPGWQPP